jgi:membrane protease YdiL (CAAX protease family)
MGLRSGSRYRSQRINSSMHSSQTTQTSLRLAAFWGILGGLGTLAGFPYLLAITPATAPPPPFPLPVLAILSAGQSGILLCLLSWLGLRLGYPLGLDTPLARALVYRQPFPKISKSGLRFALVSGIGGGLILIALVAAFQPFLPPTPASTTLRIDLWKRLLASFYGGITEEVLLRLFLMTGITWVLWKAGCKAGKRPSQGAVWGAIALSALLFSLAHLPATAAIWPLTPIVIIRAVVLNGLISLAFGFLYWRWGLEYAILSHFCADIVLHGLGSS